MTDVTFRGKETKNVYAYGLGARGLHTLYMMSNKKYIIYDILWKTFEVSDSELFVILSSRIVLSRQIKLSRPRLEVF